MAPGGMTTDAEDHGDAPAQPLDPTVQSKQPAAGKPPAAAAGNKPSKKQLASIKLAAVKETEAAAYAVASELFSM